jgi:hypothetical protein
MATATPRPYQDICPRIQQKRRARKFGVVGCQLQRRSVVAITPRCAAVRTFGCCPGRPRGLNLVAQTPVTFLKSS